MIPELGSADQSIDAVSGITPLRTPTRKHSHTQIRTTHTHTHTNIYKTQLLIFKKIELFHRAFYFTEFDIYQLMHFSIQQCISL